MPRHFPIQAGDAGDLAQQPEGPLIEQSGMTERRDVFIPLTPAREWGVFTMRAMQAITRSGSEGDAARAALEPFLTAPVSEALPGQALEALENVPKVRALLHHRGDWLLAWTGIAPIPEERFGPDLMHGGDMTMAERSLVRDRYIEARDVKLIALAAGLYEEPMSVDEADDRGLLHHTLRSGVMITASAAAYEQAPDLINPAAWQSRRQIKDRVWTATVNGREYILKERKTARHADTKMFGHEEGLTSDDEFDRALQFSALGTVATGDGSIRAHWERPVGYVHFPDGFSFCVFEPEARLAEAKPHEDFREHLDSVKAELHQAILQAPALYRAEFEAIRTRASQIFTERPDVLHHFDTGAPDPAGELTFEEFASLKARHVVDSVPDHLKHVMWGMGVVNSDLDGYYLHVAVDQASHRPFLEASVFDYEYYGYDPAAASEQASRAEAQRVSGEGIDNYIVTTSGERTMMAAASYALLESEGWRLPETFRTSRIVFNLEGDDGPE